MGLGKTLIKDRIQRVKKNVSSEDSSRYAKKKDEQMKFTDPLPEAAKHSYDDMTCL